MYDIYFYSILGNVLLVLLIILLSYLVYFRCQYSWCNDKNYVENEIIIKKNIDDSLLSESMDHSLNSILIYCSHFKAVKFSLDLIRMLKFIKPEILIDDIRLIEIFSKGLNRTNRADCLKRCFKNSQYTKLVANEKFLPV